MAWGRKGRAVVLAAALVAASACGGGAASRLAANPDAPPVFHADGMPERLSQWNLIATDGGRLRLARGALPYDLATPLFSDYASKLRVVWLPKGTSATYRDPETFDFPVGTIIAKTFYYARGEGGTDTVLRAADTTAERLAGGFGLSGVRLVETRLLVHRAEGWVALPYVWNADQSDAELKRTGAVESLAISAEGGSSQPLNYVVPNANQCQGCHATNATTRKIHPIGPTARHLNRDFLYPAGSENQLAHWARTSALQGLPDATPASLPKSALWGDASQPLEQRARSYLEINCAHCHNPVGPADTSGLNLEASAPLALASGLCKTPIAAGTGTGDREYVIVPGHPEASIMSYRMASTKPSEMMPELGRSLAHEEGVTLIDEWISSLAGSCK